MDDEYLKFYHISRDASDEKANQFLTKGIAPKQGNGYGGQGKGFYCWTSEDRANKYYCSLLVAADAEWAMKNFGIDIRLKNDEALKIELLVKKEAIKYPDWQLDNEQHPNAKRGRSRSIFLDFWEAQKNEFSANVNFEIENSLGEKSIVNKLGWDDEAKCPIIEYVNSSGKKIAEKVDSTNANNSYRTQAINNYLCSNSPSYKNNYDKLIQAIAANKDNVDINGTLLYTTDIPIKYCSQEQIRDLNVSRLKGKVVYDPAIGKRTAPESANEMVWGDYRISIKEQKLYNTRDETSKKIESLRNKIKAHNTKSPYKPTYNNISKVDLSTLKFYQNKKQNG